MNPKLFFSFILFIIYACNAYSQNHISGIVLDTNNDSIDVYQVDIYNTSEDTVLVNSVFFEKNEFQVNTPLSKDILLLVHAFGYEPYTTHVNLVNNTCNLGIIRLIQKDFVLNDVVVEGNKQVVKMEGSKTTINVRNSTLKDMGDVNDVLSRIPGVMRMGKNLVVIGRGTPAIYIDDKLVRSVSELSILKSGDIAEIIVDKNPSAVYSASTNAVIRIKTIPKVKDMVGVSAYTTSSFRRKYSNYSAVQADIKKGAFSAKLGYQYGKGETKTKERSYRYMYYPTYTFYNNIDYTINSKTQSNRVFGTFNFELNPNSKIGLQYIGSFADDNEYIPKKQYIEKELVSETRVINQKGKEERTLHTLSANYIYRKDGTVFQFITDYASQRGKSDNLIDETNLSTAYQYQTSYNTNNKYNIYTANLGYLTNLFNGYNTSVGARYAYINNDVTTDYTNNDYSENKLKNNFAAIYLQSKKTFKKVELSAGIRYEYDNAKINSFEDSAMVYKRRLSDFMPNVTIEYNPNDNLGFEVSYSKKISRPSYNYMSPIIFYVDSLSYISGTPNIKPTYSNRFSLITTLWKKFSFDFSYVRYKDQIFQTDIVNPKVENGIMTIPINLKKTESFDISLSYSDSYKKWSGNFMVQTEMPRIKVPYLSETINIKKPTWTFSVNNELVISEHISIYQNFTYTTSGYSSLTYQRPTNDLKIGAIGAFFSKKLIVKIEGTDLLDGANWNNWDVNYRNIHSGCRGNYDTRGINISLTYKLNVIKSKAFVASSNSDILNRAN